LLHGDLVRLAQVFANLLNNAAKYTDSGGPISVTARLDGEQVRVSVRDTGIGIQPEMLPRVFEMFTQVGPADSRAQGGLGIGLALVRALVEMHGGRVEAQSGGPGQGSEFVVRLPVVGTSAKEIGTAQRASKPSGQVLSQRVLVVDDNHDAADSLGMLLKFLGADVRIAYDGASAIEAAEAFRPAVVFLDIGMPGMDGLEVARRIHEREGLRSVTLIALTGWSQEDDRRRTRLAGIDYHLVKPADLNALQALLVSLEGSSHER
jgi:CheY-like chemotaxis protein